MGFTTLVCPEVFDCETASATEKICIKNIAFKLEFKLEFMNGSYFQIDFDSSWPDDTGPPLCVTITSTSSPRPPQSWLDFDHTVEEDGENRVPKTRKRMI